MQQYERDTAKRIELEREQLFRLQTAEAAYFKGERSGEEGLDEWLRREWNIPPQQEYSTIRVREPVVTCYIES